MTGTVSHTSDLHDSGRRPVLFPVETINRELDFRLALAVMFASRQRRIYLGQHDALHDLIPLLEGGIYVGKNIFRTSPPADLATYGALKDQRFNVVYLHEEGAFFRGQEDDWHAKLDSQYDPTVFDGSDLICTWGEFQADHDRSRAPRLHERIRVTGHPRFDLYKPSYRDYFADEARSLRRRHGPFVLVNTNLALANHGRGLEHVFDRSQLTDEQSVRSRIAAWSHYSHVLTDLAKLVWTLALANRDITFVLRPHPSEDHDHYRSIFQAAPNVRVLHEGTVGPWLVGAEAVVHDGCTTAVEAQLAGTPVLTFDSGDDPRFSSFVPNLMGVRCRNIDEAEEGLEEALNSGKPSPLPDLPDRALGLFHNFHNDAFVPLLDAMAEGEAAIPGTPRSGSLMAVARRHGMRRARLAARRPAYRFAPGAAQRHIYHRTKFYGFDRTEVQERLDMLQRSLGKRVVSRQISDQLIVIDG